MPRFFYAAIPYYGSVFITMIGFFVFVMMLMFSKEKGLGKMEKHKKDDGDKVQEELKEKKEDKE
jgi:hypothetical protein